MAFDLRVVAQWPGPHLPSSVEFEQVPTMRLWPRAHHQVHILPIVLSIVYLDRTQEVLKGDKNILPADDLTGLSQTFQ